MAAVNSLKTALALFAPEGGGGKGKRGNGPDEDMSDASTAAGEAYDALKADDREAFVDAMVACCMSCCRDYEEAPGADDDDADEE
jgi:hypothetical protein